MIRFWLKQPENVSARPSSGAMTIINEKLQLLDHMRPHTFTRSSLTWEPSKLFGRKPAGRRERRLWTEKYRWCRSHSAPDTSRSLGRPLSLQRWPGHCRQCCIYHLTRLENESQLYDGVGQNLIPTNVSHHSNLNYVFGLRTFPPLSVAVNYFRSSFLLRYQGVYIYTDIRTNL